MWPMWRRKMSNLLYKEQKRMMVLRLKELKKELELLNPMRDTMERERLKRMVDITCMQIAIIAEKEFDIEEKVNEIYRG